MSETELSRRQMLEAAAALTAAGAAAAALTNPQAAGAAAPGAPTSAKSSQGDIAFIPKGFAHYIENVGSTPLRWVLVFNNSNFDNIGLSTTFEGMPTHVFTETLGLPRKGLAKASKPDTTEFIVN